MLLHQIHNPLWLIANGLIAREGDCEVVLVRDAAHTEAHSTSDHHEWVAVLDEATVFKGKVVNWSRCIRERAGELHRAFVQDEPWQLPRA